MNKNCKIAIIGSGKMACHFIDKADEMGVYTLCFAKEPGNVYDHPVGRFYGVDIFDIEQIANICRQEDVKGLLPTTELTIAVVGRLASILGLNSNNLELMENVTSKQWVRDRAAYAKLFCQPEYKYLNKDDDLESQISNLLYPIIIKPVSEGGKRGITVVNEKEGLLKALDDAFLSDKHNNGIIIEQFLTEGREFSVEGLSYHGMHQIIQVTDNISSGPPHCSELGHSQPADVSVSLRRKIIQAVKELLDLIGFENGGTHTEIKLYHDKIYLIELNARLGGDSIAFPLTELSTGYDYLQENIKVAMDIEPEIRGNSPGIRYSGIRFVTTQTSQLKKIFDECDDKPWLYKKVKVTDALEERNGNGIESNYFIYVSDEKPRF